MESIRIVVSVKPPVARVDTAENGPAKACAEPIENENAQKGSGVARPGRCGLQRWLPRAAGTPCRPRGRACAAPGLPRLGKP